MLISKEELQSKIADEIGKCHIKAFDTSVNVIMQLIRNIPAAEVQPIKHGRWTDNVYKYVKSLDAYFIQAKCSVCGRYSDRIDIYSRFMSNECCSRCGARMDGDTECHDTK